MPTVSAWKALAGDGEELLAALRGDPTAWLPAPATGRGPGHFAVTLVAGPVSRLATCMVSAPLGEGATVVRHLRWQVDPDRGPTGELVRVLPSFEGTLALQLRGGEWPTLRLEGQYRPPTGPLGAQLGPAQIRALAESTVEWFLEHLVATLTEQPSPST